MFQGNTLSLNALENGFFELQFDLQNTPVNVISQAVFNELEQVLTLLDTTKAVKGLLISSAKDSFIVGADISEFSSWFDQSEEALIASNLGYIRIFNAFEDLPFPTVALINGMALGGGLEFALTADYRIMADHASIGLPEVNLGLNPGWGGCVRLPRLIGLQDAVDWICNGRNVTAPEALEAGAVDAVVANADLHSSALSVLENTVRGPLNHIDTREQKLRPMLLGGSQQAELLADVIKKYGEHYPAPQQAVATLFAQASEERDAALELETRGFVRLAQSPESRALVNGFFNQQELKRATKGWLQQAVEVKNAAVLGAGIMGGGIAYQSAVSGVPILMKDIRQDALDLGMGEAEKLLNKQVQRGKLSEQQAVEIGERIFPTLEDNLFATTDLLVEAVVENPQIKAAVLSDVEKQVSEQAVLASNTSTISITQLAQGLQKPERFCGIHFFNPVPLMPLVEVIRGERTDDSTVATAVAWAKKLGKTPIVVNDCPGFLVNRILFPYLKAFSMLVADGVDFQRIDRVMEGFGWPMGPAYLMDVIGIDTCYHADLVLAEGYPDRMNHEGTNALDLIYQLERYGQKNGRGFYRYEKDERGRLQRCEDPVVYAELKQIQQRTLELSDAQILERMMIPLCLEAKRCLEDGVVASAAEVDMGLILGLNFPRFHGGAIRYIEEIGEKAFMAKCALYAELGELYQPTAAN